MGMRRRRIKKTINILQYHKFIYPFSNVCTNVMTVVRYPYIQFTIHNNNNTNNSKNEKEYQNEIQGEEVAKKMLQ